MNIFESYEKDVEAIIKMFKDKHNIINNDGYWVGDEIGGLYDFGNDMVFNFTDVLWDLKKNAPKEDFFNYNKYISRVVNINTIVGTTVLRTMNYRSWIEGCPHYTDAELSKIERKWKDVVSEITKLGENKK